MENGFEIMNYLIYIVLTVSVTIWVARTLSTNGAHLLMETFEGQEELAKAVNKLLVVGFYLVNIGYLSYTIKFYGQVNNIPQLIEALGLKVGGIVLLLGVMHFGNLFVLFRIRKAALNRKIQSSAIQNGITE